MAHTPSPTVEELQLRKRARRRLIGAVTLVALMVTVLPMVLDNEPKPVGQDIAINIPSQQNTGFPPKTAPPPVVTAPAVSPAPARPPVPAEAEKRAAPKPPEPKQAAPREKTTAEKAPAEKPREMPDKPKETAKAAEPPHAGGTYVIMLGAFLSESNARQRQGKLKELGIKHYEEKISSPAGEKIGVRAGPYPTRAEAEKILARLKESGIGDGLVTEKK